MNVLGEDVEKSMDGVLSNTRHGRNKSDSFCCLRLELDFSRSAWLTPSLSQVSAASS